MTRLGLTAFALLLGCGSSPEPTFYALAPTRGAENAAPVHVIEMRRPGVPGYLDRSDIVTGVASYRLRVANTERWGEPLGDMIARVLAQDLQQRLPGSVVFTEAGALAASPDALVEVDIQRFDAGQDGAVTLAAQVVVQSGQERALLATRSLRLSARSSGAGTAALAATMSALLGQLADQIADAFHARPTQAKIP